jgi:integrase
VTSCHRPFRKIKARVLRTVNQHLDSVKTENSRKVMSLDPQLLSVLSAWKHSTEFGDTEDWMFPSPVKLGHFPYSYTGYWRALQEAAIAAGIDRLGTHSFRHYAESRTMPHRVLSKLGLALKSAANPLPLMRPMRHSPVCLHRLFRKPSNSSSGR